jgi:hypothetical protein
MASLRALLRARSRGAAGRDRPPRRPCSSPAPGRRVIEGAHLLGDETGAAGSAHRTGCCNNATNAGRRAARERECCSRRVCGSPPRPWRQCRRGRASTLRPRGRSPSALTRHRRSNVCPRRATRRRLPVTPDGAGAPPRGSTLSRSSAPQPNRCASESPAGSESVVVFSLAGRARVSPSRLAAQSRFVRSVGGGAVAGSARMDR